MEQLQFSVLQKNCISISGADELQTFIKMINDGFQIKSISHENRKSFTTAHIIYQVSAEGKRGVIPQTWCKYPSFTGMRQSCCLFCPFHSCFMMLHRRSTLGGGVLASLTIQASLGHVNPLSTVGYHSYYVVMKRDIKTRH